MAVHSRDGRADRACALPARCFGARCFGHVPRVLGHGAVNMNRLRMVGRREATLVRDQCRARARGPCAWRLGREVHDRIEPGEGIELAPPLGRIAEQRNERRGDAIRRAVALEIFRHGILAEHEVCEDHGVDARHHAEQRRPPRPGCDRPPPSAPARARVPASRCRRPQARRARCGTRHISRPRRSRCGAAPASRRSRRVTCAAICGSVGSTRSSGPARSATLRDRRAEDRGQPADFAAAGCPAAPAPPAGRPAAARASSAFGRRSPIRSASGWPT